LVELHVVLHGGGVDALVVVVDRDRERLLRLLLTDHVLIEDVLDLRRCGYLGDRFGNFALFVFREDLVAEGDALVADVDRRARDELPDRVLRLSAKRTAQVFVVGHGRGLQMTPPGREGRPTRREGLRGIKAQSHGWSSNKCQTTEAGPSNSGNANPTTPDV